jgi:hypothetical protein
MHARYFLEGAEVIRQVHGAKELAAITTSGQKLDEVDHSPRAIYFKGQKQFFSFLAIRSSLLVAHHWGECAVYIVLEKGEPPSRLTRNNK